MPLIKCCSDNYGGLYSCSSDCRWEHCSMVVWPWRNEWCRRQVFARFMPRSVNT